MKDNIKQANMLFEKINKELTPKYKGKIVALEAESGSYFIGDTEIDAYKRAIKEYPDKKFIFKRIGFKSSHFVGAI